MFQLLLVFSNSGRSLPNLWNCITIIKICKAGWNYEIYTVYTIGPLNYLPSARFIIRINHFGCRTIDEPGELPEIDVNRPNRFALCRYLKVFWSIPRSFSLHQNTGV